MEISPIHHAMVIGANHQNLKEIMQETGTKILFPDAHDPNIPILKKSNVTITGNIHNVYAARQILTVSIAEFSNLFTFTMLCFPAHRDHCLYFWCLICLVIQPITNQINWWRFRTSVTSALISESKANKIRWFALLKVPNAMRVSLLHSKLIILYLCLFH